MAKSVGIGLLGLGVVGGGVARVLSEKADQLEELVGASIALEGVLVKDLNKVRPYSPPSHLLTTRAEDIFENPRVDIIVEAIGGQDPALDYLLKSISLGKHVVTANKEVMARHGQQILELAWQKNTQILFEASVAGGTPVIGPLVRELAANEIVAIHSIINGTTNYILTRMAQQGADFDEALAEAQRLGYAEADPEDDVGGVDAAYKLAILSTLAFGARVRDTDVSYEGIKRLKSRDFLYAEELGYTIKLLAIANKQDGAIQARVHPAFVPADMMIAKVDGVLNAVEIETDLAGQVLFHGMGAGAMPTAGAIVADIVEISHNVLGEVVPPRTFNLPKEVRILPISELETKYYLRLNVADQPGVLAQIEKLLKDLQIGITSILHVKGRDFRARRDTNIEDADEMSQRAELVLVTNRVKEMSLQKALELLRTMDIVRGVGNVVRVEEW